MIDVDKRLRVEGSADAPSTRMKPAFFKGQWTFQLGHDLGMTEDTLTTGLPLPYV